MESVEVGTHQYPRYGDPSDGDAHGEMIDFAVHYQRLYGINTSKVFVQPRPIPWALL
jgi:hypothetical protein